MRITGTGHAGMRIDTPAGSILCDPWVNPAYFAAWFPFPDNSRLDWAVLGRTDFLYVSQLRRDHLDAAHLKRFVSKQATVLLPGDPTGELRAKLAGLGFTRFRETTSNEVIDLGGGLRVSIQACTGGSALWVEYDGVRLLNQNDARPPDLGAFARLGQVHAHLLQFSGAGWYPMVYQLPWAAKAALGRRNRDRRFDRTLRYVDELNASWVFPIAGPPCFLDEELWRFNDIHGDAGNIFPDQQAFLDRYAKAGRRNGVALLPGSVAELSAGGCEVRHPVPDLAEFFAGKAAHLREYQARMRPGIEAAKLSWRHPQIDVVKELKWCIEPLLEASRHLARAVGEPVRFDLVGYEGESIESVLVDFPGRTVRRPGGERVRYRWRTERALIEHLLHTGEVDWVDSLFRSCRFSAARIGRPNEFVYAFFGSLSEQRLPYAESRYAPR